MDHQPERRRALKIAMVSLGAALGSRFISGCGPLSGADANGVLLPAGFSSRIIARSGEAVGGSAYTWHGAPDGGATFATGDGGWIYVSNSELSDVGGVGAIRFDSNGNIIDAYPILSGTSRNCAGGKTPWGTWLSCEENGDAGRVFECDPLGLDTAIERPALGYFNHEAVAVDHDLQQLYLTEDRTDGCLYRFTPDNYPDLSSGLLEVARSTLSGASETLDWVAVPDPGAVLDATRYQQTGVRRFNGGEGIAYRSGAIYFTTKGDNRVWCLHTASQELTTVYDAALYENPILTGVDNLTISQMGELYVAEDLGDMQIVAISLTGVPRPVVQVTGHPLSEITGPAFSPDGTRLYFSSQRGAQGLSATGVSYEVSGPF